MKLKLSRKLVYCQVNSVFRNLEFKKYFRFDNSNVKFTFKTKTKAIVSSINNKCLFKNDGEWLLLKHNNCFYKTQYLKKDFTDKLNKQQKIIDHNNENRKILDGEENIQQKEMNGKKDTMNNNSCIDLNSKKEEENNNNNESNTQSDNLLYNKTQRYKCK